MLVNLRKCLKLVNSVPRNNNKNERNKSRRLGRRHWRIRNKANHVWKSIHNQNKVHFLSQSEALIRHVCRHLFDTCYNEQKCWFNDVDNIKDWRHFFIKKKTYKKSNENWGRWKMNFFQQQLLGLLFKVC